jgi:hypothetical protein
VRGATPFPLFSSRQISLAFGSHRRYILSKEKGVVLEATLLDLSRRSKVWSKNSSPFKMNVMNVQICRLRQNTRLHRRNAVDR